MEVLAGGATGAFAERSAPTRVLAAAEMTGGPWPASKPVVEESVPEAHEALPEGEGRLAPLAFVGGFVLFAPVSAYHG